MRSLTGLAVLLSVLIASSARAQACPTPTAQALWLATSDAQRAGSQLPDSRSQVAEVELTGAAPNEAALAFDELEGEPRTRLWVYACQQGQWASLAHAELDINRGWDGTIDTRPGVQRLQRETFAGAHEFLRLEHVDVNGGSDPRFVRRRLLLFHLVRGELSPALDLTLDESNESGPERETTMTSTRSITRIRGTRPRYRLRVSETVVGEPRRRCTTTLNFDGERFVPRNPRCT